jgi:hypothetical protein
VHLGEADASLVEPLQEPPDVEEVVRGGSRRVVHRRVVLEELEQPSSLGV